MLMYKRGTQIAYIPSHLQGFFEKPKGRTVEDVLWAIKDLQESGVEFGFVTKVSEDPENEVCWCRYYQSGKLGDLRTVANSEQTHVRDLMVHHSVPQRVVDELLAKIERGMAR